MQFLAKVHYANIYRITPNFSLAIQSLKSFMLHFNQFVEVSLDNFYFSQSKTTCIAIYICSNRRSIPKVENFFEVIVPRMAPKHFRRYFRMYEDTLESIISYLALEEPFTSLLDRGQISRHKKVAMTCAYLGSKQTIMQ